MAITKTVQCKMCGAVSDPFFPKNQERTLQKQGWTLALEGWICSKSACRAATGARYVKVPASAGLPERRYY